MSSIYSLTPITSGISDVNIDSIVSCIVMPEYKQFEHVPSIFMYAIPSSYLTNLASPPSLIKNGRIFSSTSLILSSILIRTSKQNIQVIVNIVKCKL